MAMEMMGNSCNGGVSGGGAITSGPCGTAPTMCSKTPGTSWAGTSGHKARGHGGHAHITQTTPRHRRGILLELSGLFHSFVVARVGLPAWPPHIGFVMACTGMRKQLKDMSRESF